VEHPDVAAMRRSYTLSGLTEADLAADWVTQLGSWMADAVAADLVEPNAMTLATASQDGRPSARTVLLKGYDSRGFTLFTNYGSRKGGELAANPYASLVIPWVPLQRQVIACGAVVRVDESESAAYFHSRPRGSQLGASASPQSRVIAGRDELERAVADLADRYPEGTEIPLPPYWGGFRVVPETVEFWQGRPDRLHDRLRYRRDGDRWVIERLAP
jgi:pyridoxamine 5'-phosphate oxidase